MNKTNVNPPVGKPDVNLLEQWINSGTEKAKVLVIAAEITKAAKKLQQGKKVRLK
jgi:hypothetical protein